MGFSQMPVSMSPQMGARLRTLRTADAVPSCSVYAGCTADQLDVKLVSKSAQLINVHRTTVTDAIHKANDVVTE